RGAVATAPRTQYPSRGTRHAKRRPPMPDYRIISADSHFTIPAPLIQEFLPERYRANVLVAAGSATAPPSANPPPVSAAGSKVAAAMKALEREGRPPGRAGGHDPLERLQDMDPGRAHARVT